MSSRLSTSIRPRWLWTILILAALVGALGWAANLALFAISPSETASPGRELVIEVKQRPLLGETIRATTEALLQAGIIRDGKKFVRLGKWLRKWPQVKAGEYRVSSRMSPIEIFSILTSGVSIGYPLTIREGANLYQVAESLEKLGLVKRQEFIDLCKSQETLRALGFGAGGEALPPSMEGYLFPQTYFLNRSMSPMQILKKIYARFEAEWRTLEKIIPTHWKYTRHQTVTLASIIEKETGAPEERALISSVFHNRLQKRMRLQSDPTTIYGMWETYNGNIRRDDLLRKTPYNTYAINGLPIGPIANPGREALIATLNPVASDYLYFVSKNDGTHEFTRRFEDHNDAVRRFQLDRKAREGKSWRDLKKRPQ